MAERHEGKAAIDFGFLTGKVKLGTEEVNSRPVRVQLVHQRQKNNQWC